MHRPIVLLLALSLTATVPLVLGDATATSHPLVADAGDSVYLVDATGLPVTGSAQGGLAPYTFAWSYVGDGSRFADPSAASTTFDATGLAPADLPLTLTVTDANGDVALDTVVHRADDAGVRLFEATVDVGPGANVLVPARGAFVLATETFDVPPATAALRVRLAWDNPNGLPAAANDLALVVERHNGNVAGVSATADNPEEVLVANVVAGTWLARIEGDLNGPVAATLTVDAFPLVEVRHNGPYLFGALDRQTPSAQAYGTGVSIAWDANLDGAFELAGASPDLDLAPGTHTVRVRATTAEGYEATKSTSVTVRTDFDHALALACSDVPSRPFKPMEFTAAGDVCWMHGGHHTYFLGPGAHRLLGGQGRLTSVEQPLSPPAELGDPPTTAPVRIQTSLDGQVWHDVGVASFDLVSGTLGIAVGGGLRQVLDVTLDATDEPFRYLRIHEPRSAAQGLSGFLDASRLELFTQEVPFTAPALAADQGRAYDCENGDILEDLFADHPCWFGGVNRYDAPSFFHTYTTGDGATLTSISGSVRVAPWRTDDWFRPITGRIGDVTDTSVAVQTSADGITWTTERVVPMTHGVNRPFAFDLDDRPAAFVRLVPEAHRLFDDFREEPSLHHPEAFIVESTLSVEGTLPVALVSTACEANPAAVTLDDRVHVLAGSPPGNVWLYLESNGHRGLQAGAQQVLGLYHHSPEDPEDCDVADTLLL